MNGFQKFFIFCSGSDPTTLADATSAERNTFVTLGITTLIPPLVGFCSGGYVARLLTGDQQIAVTFGMLWALVIFIIDRAVVSSMSKSLLPAVGRLSLAIVIALVVSLPFELFVFRDVIIDELNRAYTDDVAEVQTFYTPKIEAINADLRQREIEINSLRDGYLAEMDGSDGSGDRGYGPYAKRKQLEYEQAKSGFTDYRQSRLLEQNQLKQQVANDIIRLKNKQATGLLGQWKALGQLAEREPYVQYASWAFTLLLVLIELIPILVKLSSSTTLYQRLLRAGEEAAYITAVSLIASREENKAFRAEMIHQRELYRMMLEKGRDAAQHQVDRAEVEIGHLHKMGQLEEKASELVGKLSIRLTKIDDLIDKLQKIIDHRSENIFEITQNEAAIDDFLSGIKNVQQ